jgi:hypothetical protein
VIVRGAFQRTVALDAMQGKSMVALGHVSERVVTLQPWGKGLLGTTVRCPYEARPSAAPGRDSGRAEQYNGDNAIPAEYAPRLGVILACSTLTTSSIPPCSAR